MLIKREIFPVLLEHLSRKEITLIVGPRQAGKTTLMNLLQEELIKKGATTLFMSLDFERDMPFFRSQQTLIERLSLEFGSQKGFVFIDEIQRKRDAGLFLKGIYDMNLPYKFIISGSGSLELKEKIHESLIGRKRLFELNTLSLKEFINFKTAYKYEDRLKEFFRIDPLAKDLLMEYMNFGGYPRVVLENRLNQKIAVIDDIYRSYLEKDISFLLRLEKMDALKDLVKLLAAQIGGLVNLTELSSTTGISIPTLKNYLYYLEKTFIIKRVTPFYRNIRKEITKSPVFYFYDMGLRNFAIGQFGRLDTINMGFLFENLIFNLLKERFPEVDIHFWRTTDGAEVDFIIEFPDSIIPVEVKFKELKETRISRSLKSFILKYSPSEAWIINLSLKEEERIENTLIRFMPFWELIKT